jgi:hypothetical protein
MHAITQHAPETVGGLIDLLRDQYAWASGSWCIVQTRATSRLIPVDPFVHRLP